MTEAGGTATQAGIFYQNSVAALVLADMLDLNPLPARERVLDVRVEAPEHVDDIVVNYADSHRQFMTVKLSITKGGSAWAPMLLGLQKQLIDSSDADELTIVVATRSKDSLELAELCERARSSLSEDELRKRITHPQEAVFASVIDVVGSSNSAFELLGRISVRHLPEDEISLEFARRRLAGDTAVARLLPALRDIVGGAARKRGLFRAAQLRRQLDVTHGIRLAEPLEWGVASYREMLLALARIDVPGTRVSGPTSELFVWPRARGYDLSRRADFEDEYDVGRIDDHDGIVDLQMFPSDDLEKIIVVAGPGYGKSALLTALAGILAPGPFVPVILPLASFAPSAESVIEFLAGVIAREMDLRADWQRLAEQGLLVVFFDGLDEVPARERPGLLQRIATFSARYPRVSWILTVRDASVISGLAEAKVVELLPLSGDDIERFVKAMHRFVSPTSARDFSSRLRRHPDLDRLARIPLFLTILLATADLSHTVSLTRSDLIETYLKTLFSPAEHKLLKDSTDVSEQLRVIAERLAFERLENQEIGATEREVLALATEILQPQSEARLLLDKLIANGILRRQSSIRLQFPFPIVQEYLAAKFLLANYHDSIESRIADAIQRPWAQVIQFALEMHPAPSPIIRKILERKDDAFRTGLRLVARCVVNGAKIDDKLRRDIGDRLVDYWVSAPTGPRERVGGVLLDGFSDAPSPALRDALLHPWLINYGSGEILSKLGDESLTLSLLERLMEERHTHPFLYYHALRPAFKQAEGAALQAIAQKLQEVHDDFEESAAISSLLANFEPSPGSRSIALAIARDAQLTPLARARGYELAGSPLEPEGIEFALDCFRSNDREKSQAATDLIAYHPDPPTFLSRILHDDRIALEERKDIASRVVLVIPDAVARTELWKKCADDSALEPEIKLIIRLFEARFGNRAVFETLVRDLDTNPVETAATTISLFGHYRDQALAEEAAKLVKRRLLRPYEVVRMANAASTGMLYVFEMNYGFGGSLLRAPNHPGISSWVELVEHWATRDDLTPHNRLDVLIAGAALGSEILTKNLVDLIFEVNFDDPQWTVGDVVANSLSRALHEIQKQTPIFPAHLVEKLLSAKEFNVVTRGIGALSAIGDMNALERLIAFHESARDWHLRDVADNVLESMSAKLGVVLMKSGQKYEIAPPSPP